MKSWPARIALSLVLSSALSACLPMASAMARDWPYDERADAKADVSQALNEAASGHQAVLLIFGANWCEDCRALDTAIKQTHNAELLAKDFKIVKINVGNFDRNLDVAQRYGNPIRNGIPAAVILSSDGKLIYATEAGELADARHMNDEGVERFFMKALRQVLQRQTGATR